MSGARSPSTQVDSNLMSTKCARDIFVKCASTMTSGSRLLLQQLSSGARVFLRDHPAWQRCNVCFHVQCKSAMHLASPTIGFDSRVLKTMRGLAKAPSHARGSGSYPEGGFQSILCHDFESERCTTRVPYDALFVVVDPELRLMSRGP